MITYFTMSKERRREKTAHSRKKRWCQRRNELSWTRMRMH